MSPPRVPGYRILSELSRGGQGAVFLAVQLATKRQVAIKTLLAGLQADDISRKRFQREIELQSQLRHPNIVTIFEAGTTEDGRQYHVMDYVPGRPLDRYIQDEGSSPSKVLQIFLQVCDAVHTAHSHGIIHRDLKPQNILVDAQGRPHVLDFGLARALAVTGESAVSLGHAVLGTVPFMSPEQAAGNLGLVDAQTDVYALGVVLYWVLTNRFPYNVTRTLHDALEQIQHAAPDPPSRHDARISKDLETILLKCLSKERARRYQGVRALADDIRRLLDGKPITARRDSLAYHLRKSATRAAVLHPRLTDAVVLLVTLGVFVPLANRFFFDWTSLGMGAQQRLLHSFTAAATGPGLKHVRLIALTDRMDVAAIAKREKLSGVDPGKKVSLRRLYGRLMERLAEAGPRAVVWNYTFAGQTEYDADFKRGADRLRAVGAGVVVAVKKWPFYGLQDSDLSPTIAASVKWGRPAASLLENQPWELLLFLSRESFDPVPSLVLAGLAVARQPEAEFTIRVNPSDSSLRLTYYRRDPAVPQSRQWLETTDTIHFTGLTTVHSSDAQSGVVEGDAIARFFLTIPEREALSNSTIDMQDAFAVDWTALARDLSGKVIVLADMRGKADRHPYRDGRSIHAGEVIAVGLERLLEDSAITRPAQDVRVTLTAAAAALGIFIGRKSDRRWMISGLSAMVAALLLVGISWIALRSSHLFCNPVIPVFALLSTCVMTQIARLGTRGLKEGGIS